MKSYKIVALLLVAFFAWCAGVFAAEICITVPDYKIIKAARQKNYENTVINSAGTVVPNPKTKLRHVKEIIKEFINDLSGADDMKIEGKAALRAIRQKAKLLEDDVIISSGG